MLGGVSKQRTYQITSRSDFPKPVLRGKQLAARPVRAADFEALYAAASDPLIWEQHPVKDRHRREVFAEFFADALASGGALTVLDEAGEVIGSSR